MYSPPDLELLQESSHALYVTQYMGNNTLKVITIKSIATCVAIIPFTSPPDGRFFVCDKMGLQIGLYSGSEENPNDPNDSDA